MKAALSGTSVGRVMITEFETLAPTDTLQDALSHVVAGFQHDFPVVDGGRVVGVLTRTDLTKGLAQKGADASVAVAMNTGFDTADPAEMVENAVQRLQVSGCPTMPVVRGGELVGILTMENVAELLMFRTALRGGTRRSQLARTDTVDAGDP
jgi:predicted transcriptional regulator